MGISQQIKPKVDTYNINQIKLAKEVDQVKQQLLSLKSKLNLCLDINADLSYKKLEYLDGIYSELLSLQANLTTWLLPIQDTIFIYVPQSERVVKNNKSLTIY